MTTASFDRLLDPTKLDPARVLRRHGCDWALFGLSLDPEAWLEADAQTQRAIDPIWRAADGWSREHPGALHGLIVGARAAIRALRAAGVHIANRAWADLGGATGHYAIALVLEGAAHAAMIDEREPGALARSVMNTLKIDVRVDGVSTTALASAEAFLALYSFDPAELMRACPWIQTAVVAPVVRRARRGQRIRVVAWQGRLVMGEGACALESEPETTSMEVRERVSRWLRDSPRPGARS